MRLQCTTGNTHTHKGRLTLHIELRQCHTPWQNLRLCTGAFVLNAIACSPTHTPVVRHRARAEVGRGTGTRTTDVELSQVVTLGHRPGQRNRTLGANVIVCSPVHMRRSCRQSCANSTWHPSGTCSIPANNVLASDTLAMDGQRRSAAASATAPLGPMLLAARDATGPHGRVSSVGGHMAHAASPSAGATHSSASSTSATRTLAEPWPV